MKKKTYYVNPYLGVGFLISLILIIFGVSYINKIFENDLPINFNFDSLKGTDNTNVREISEVYCKSRNPHNFEIFVLGDQLDCNFNLTYNKNPMYKLARVSLFRKNLDDVYVNIRNDSVDNYNNSFIFSIPLNYEGLNYYIIDLDFMDNKYRQLNSLYYANIGINVNSYKDYKERPQKKYASYTALISFAIFSVLVAMKNLRDVIEPK